MRGKNFGIKIALVSLAILNCSVVDIKTKQEFFSPNNSFRIIEQSVGAGATTKQLSKVFIAYKDYIVKKDSTPVLITEEDNILSISWKDDKNILINVKSRSLIYFQVVKDHGFNIVVEAEE